MANSIKLKNDRISLTTYLEIENINNKIFFTIGIEDDEFSCIDVALNKQEFNNLIEHLINLKKELK